MGRGRDTEWRTRPVHRSHRVLDPASAGRRGRGAGGVSAWAGYVWAIRRPFGRFRTEVLGIGTFFHGPRSFELAGWAMCPQRGFRSEVSGSRSGHSVRYRRRPHHDTPEPAGIRRGRWGARRMSSSRPWWARSCGRRLCMNSRSHVSAFWRSLGSGSDRRLTLVACPAGFGKTTLLSAWYKAEASRRPVAWLTLDEGDNDPVVLWSHAIGALRRANPEVAKSASTIRS